MMALIAALVLTRTAAYTSPRAPVVAGNWKMNPGTAEEALALAEALDAVEGREVVVFPPSCYLEAVARKTNKNVALGAQDACVLAESGAFTGAVSLPMLKMPRVDYVLCGHSERRSLFSDDDDAIRAKVRGALDAGFAAMLCIGETQQEYELGITDDICALQLAKALEGVTAAEMANVVVAYEPVWAIGTGLVCPATVAQRVHASMRQRLRATYDSSVADACRILYGGSASPLVIDGIMRQPDIDGVLVGGAALDAATFNQVSNFHAGWWRTRSFLKKVLRR
jgi:triosephosphate isomerase